MKDLIKNISVLSVKGEGSEEYIAPQNNYEGKYPLARDLYIINCQGLWFGNGVCFICCWRHRAKDNFEGGLLPVRMPQRKVIFKNKSNNENENE
jgi:phosphate transport system substrate-binding protein